jgi:hypothetical protein
MAQDQRNQMTSVTYEVQLAIYDLSRGMARNLSSQFLGPAHTIDIIPHTAILAYGNEYYFGSGIQCESPQSFRQSRGIFPMEVQTLGRTTLSQYEFESWCRQMSSPGGTYTPVSYDLLHRNCNNFANNAALQGLRLPRGVPDWILDVPRRFLASPMGQMIRPMLENMQMTGPTGNGTAPFATTGTTGGNSNAFNAPPVPDPPPAVNPWAHLSPAPAPAPAAPPTPQANNTATTSGSITESSKTETPFLDSQNRPLLSNDINNSVSVCINKLTRDDSPLTEKQRSDLRKLGQQLTKGEKVIEKGVCDDSCLALLSILKKSKGSDVTFALMILRLVPLQLPHLTLCCDDSSEKSPLRSCLERLALILVDATTTMTLSPAARVMAWCTMGNAFGTLVDLTAGAQLLGHGSTATTLEQVMDAAVLDLSSSHQPRGEVRQAASSFLYNVAHGLSIRSTPIGMSLISDWSFYVEDNNDTLPDSIVGLICASLESLEDETDATTKLRRLLIAAKLIKTYDSSSKGQNRVHQSAKNLVNDLGFSDVITTIATEIPTTPLNKKVTQLAKEVQQMIQ